MSLTPRLWVDVTAKTYGELETEYIGLDYAFFITRTDILNQVYYDLLEPVASEPAITVRDGEVASFEDEEGPILFVEDQQGFVDEFTVVFNDDLNSPGFIVTVNGLLNGSIAFDSIDVFRRDPSGRYIDRRVRGLANVDVVENNIRVVDYEAPLNTPLEYYLRLFQGTAEFRVGPVLPTPLPYIPTLSEAYGGGTAYLKPIDIPELSRPVMVDPSGLRTWNAPARILARHNVLGRKNPVVISDVRGGREGSLRGHCILTHGQEYTVIEEIFAPGVTVLIQNHNPTVSAFPDIYVQVEDVTFERRTPMVRHGELDNPQSQQVVVDFEFSFTQVDRPDPTGDVILIASWEIVNDTFASWESVHLNRDTWLGILQQPIGPDGES